MALKSIGSNRVWWEFNQLNIISAGCSNFYFNGCFIVADINTLNFTVKKFDKAVSLHIEYPTEAVELKAAYFAWSDDDFSLSGAAIAAYFAPLGSLPVTILPLEKRQFDDDLSH